ncbi:MAG: hypothetical protein IJT70_02070 [Clostridia bacterium]|nr:hypothetical protein [Clostridia bacterium]
MKKLISVLIVAAMLFAAVASSVPVLAKDDAEFDEVAALYFDVKPTLDGIVSEEEWGRATTLVRQSDAATADDSNPRNNRYFSLNYGARPIFDASVYSMSYMMWLRWDEDYYYIAVKVQDPDGHSLKRGKNEVWNGDAFQTRIDSLGPNATSESGDPYDYDAARDGKPWSNDSLDDFCFGYVEAAGGFSEAWENKTNKGTTEYSNNPLGAVKVSIAPCGAYYSDDTASGITTYEIAIPWAFIEQSGTVVEHTYSNNSNKNPAGGIGREYGMSAVVYNAFGETGADHYNAGLGWGSGIINEQQNFHPETCDGSNSVTLSGAKVSESVGYTGVYPSGAGYVAPAKEYDYPTSIDESRYVKLTYDSRSDLEVFGDRVYGERVRDTDGNWFMRMDKASPYMPSDLTEAVMMPDGSTEWYNACNYMSSEPYSAGGCSLTMEFDVRITDYVTFEPGYDCFLTNWFGGSKGVDYTCGYNFDNGKFEIRERTQNTLVASSAPTDFAPNEWHHWVFQYFKDSCEIRFYFDPPMEEGCVAKSAVPVFRQIYRYFDAPGLNSCLLILCRMNCQADFDNVEFYNFVDYDNYDPNPEPQCDHSVTSTETHPATCVDAGYTAVTCELCGEEISRTVIPALGHDFSDEFTVDVEPTKDSAGLKSRHCSRCDAVTDETVIPKLGGLPGDANGDGRVDMRDVLLMRKHILNIRKVLPANFENADMDGDGVIRMNDVLAVRKKILNIN